jgi:hypothetical protein
MHSSLITATTPLLKSFILEFKVVGQRRSVLVRRRDSESLDANMANNHANEKSNSLAPLSDAETTPPKPKRHKVRIPDRAQANRLAAAQNEDRESDRTSNGDEIEVLNPSERDSLQV